MTNELKFPYTTPPFYFAVTEEVIAHCPTTLDDKELTADDFLPKQGRIGDTGWDCRVADPDGVTIKPNCYALIKLGFRVLCPEGWWLRLSPRSGTFAKLNLHSLYGTIDEAYEGQMCFAAHYIPDACKLLSGGKEFHLPFGTRIGQLIPMPRYEMPVVGKTNAELDEMFKARNGSRGTGGYGSSGRA